MRCNPQITLEVERKFCGLAVQQLTSHAGRPGFTSLESLTEENFHDTYYDDRNKLAARGVWLRKRQHTNQTSIWQLKCRLGGSFINSMFEETSDLKAISNRVQNITGRCEAAVTDFGLESIASLATCRRSWLADAHFKIALDSMDFGHEVGEVELEKSLATPHHLAFPADVDAWKDSITREMDLQVQNFITRYWWAFRLGTPKGKLTAYFERQH